MENLPIEKSQLSIRRLGRAFLSGMTRTFGITGDAKHVYHPSNDETHRLEQDVHTAIQEIERAAQELTVHKSEREE